MPLIDNYTTQLFHFNKTINDGICSNYTISGNLSIDKSIYKFNNGSCKFDGSSLLTLSNLDFSGDYTIDFWLYVPSLYNTDNHFMQIRTPNKGWLLGVSTSGYFMYWDTNIVSYNFFKIVLNTWYHIEVDRTNTSFYVFINGNKYDLTSMYLDVSDIHDLIFGGRYDNKYNIKCNIDELRVSIGIARHSTNFTPETREYTYGYLIKDSNDNFYNLNSANYDSENNKYNAIPDFNIDDYTQYAFELNDLYSDSPDGIQNYKLFNNNYKLVSLDQNKLLVSGSISHQEMIATLEPLSMKKYATIHKITPSYIIKGNGSIKIAFSFDDGTTWKTWDATNDWTDLSNVEVPMKLYENFTDADKTAWSNAQSEINTNGIDITNLSSVTFPTDVKKMCFIIVFNRPTYDDTATLISFDILFDGLKTFTGLDRNKCAVKFTGDTITVTPTSSADELLVTMIVGSGN